jgi:hypothetical protein
MHKKTITANNSNRHTTPIFKIKSKEPKIDLVYSFALNQFAIKKETTNLCEISGF